MSQVRENYLRTLESMDAAARKAGRDREEIRLIAVSKFHPESSVWELIQAGHYDFGENYAQEALHKQQLFSGYNLRWHFLGKPQTNKAKYLVGNFHLLHSLDSLKLARELEKRGERGSASQDVLIQVNLGQEAQKGGADEEDLHSLCEYVLSCGHLQLQGLMCMPPFFEDPEASKPLFARLRRQKQELEEKYAVSLPHLSMGMSHDFEEAIQEGATLVRIGTRIFGERPGK